MVVPHFTNMKLPSYFPVFCDGAKKFHERLRDISSQGLEMDVYEETASIALMIIGIAAFGFNFAKRENHSISQAYKRCIQPLDFFTVFVAEFVPWVRRLPVGRFYELQLAHRALHDTVTTIVRERRRQRDQRYNDMLDALLTTTDQGGHELSTEEIRDQILTFMVAGHEVRDVRTFDDNSGALVWWLDDILCFCLVYVPNVRKQGVSGSDPR